MKKILPLMISAVLSSTAIADTPSGYFVGGFIEKNITDNDKDTDARYDFIDDGNGLGLEFGYLYNSRWGGRIEWSDLNFDNALGGSDVKGDRYGIDLLYRFRDQGDVYGILGLKQLEAGDGHTALNLGLGVNQMATEHLAVFLEGAGYVGVDRSFVDFGLKMGLRYHFDTVTKEVAPAAPAAVEPVVETDADQDGVVDRLDNCPNTDATHLVDSNGCTLFEDAQVSIRLNVMFANNSAQVPQSAHAEIERLADFMKRYTDTSVEIEGHSSAKGNADYNMTLSTQRAKAIADTLVNDFAIATERVSYKGYGETRLLDSSDSAEANSKNRRIEAVVTGQERRAKLR